ncbi:MAG: hypothetical protein LQ346_003129 [Caloplaca aetnensis]|nr:MAG: hypothetical protein LQ346_003129 [Caloplaca aetnensis]
MHFFKSAALAFTLGLALIDARAINIKQGASDIETNGLKVRGTDIVQGGDLRTRGVDVKDDVSKGNAEACAQALNKLRKSKLRKSKVRKRADDDDLDDLADDMMGLGDDSYTVAQGTSDSVVFANDEDIHTFGTVGLNSCSGVLIVGNKGAIAAHINPIPANGNRDTFTQEVADVTDLFNSKRDALELGSATMYIVTPIRGGQRNGEKEVLEGAAGQLGIAVDSTEYEPVTDDEFNDDYEETGKGSIEVNWEDDGEDVHVRIFDQDK